MGFGLLGLSLVVVCCLGCGKKSPPFLPEKRAFSAHAARFEAVWNGRTLILNGTAAGNADDLAAVNGCRIQYVWYPLDDPPCEGCPIEMKSFRVVTGKLNQKNEARYEFPAFRQKGICFFAVQLMGNEGRLGLPSERLKLLSET